MDFLEELFGIKAAPLTAEEHAAVIARVDAEAAVAKDARAAAAQARIDTPCGKCQGEGRISFYSHNKGGECFACGGTGVFTKYRG